jgi:hypothetical protein
MCFLLCLLLLLLQCGQPLRLRSLRLRELLRGQQRQDCHAQAVPAVAAQEGAEGGVVSRSRCRGRLGATGVSVLGRGETAK